MKLTKRAVFLLFLTCFFSVCDTVFCVAYVYFEAQVLTGIEQGSMEIVLRCIALAGGFYLLRMVSWFLTAANRMGFLANGVTGARDRIMKNVLSRPIRIFRKQDDSYYLNLLGEDAELYRNTWLDSIYGIFSGLISVIFNAGMLFFLHPGLLMVGVITSAVPVFTSRLFTKATQKRRKAVSQTAESFTGVLKEGIEGSEALRSAKGKAPFLSRFHTACEAKADAQSKSALTNNLAFMTLLASGVVAQLACMGVGGYLSVSGLIPLATVYAALRYVTDLSNSLSNTMEDVVNFRASKPRHGCQIKKEFLPPDDEFPQPEMRTARFIAKRLEGTFSIRLPESECTYICIHLMSYNAFQEQNQAALQVPENIEMLTLHLTEAVDAEIGSKFSSDKILFFGLVYHLRNSIYQQRETPESRTRSLPELSESCMEIYHCIKNHTDLYRQYSGVTPDEWELVSLTLHFSLSQERTTVKWRALLISNAGILVQQEQRKWLQDCLPQIDIIDICTSYQFLVYPENTYDFIIATSNIEKAAKPVACIAHMDKAQSVRYVEEFIFTKLTKP